MGRAVMELTSGPASTKHVHKPYRGKSEIIEDLPRRYPDVPQEAWRHVDEDWLTIETLKGQCYKQLCDEEKPVMRLKDLVPWHVLRNGRRVKEVYNMEWWR